MFLDKKKVQTILDNAPNGVDKAKLLDGLIQRGYDIEGVDSQAARQSLGQTAQPEKQGILQGIKNNFNDIVGDFAETGEDIVSNTMNRSQNIQDLETSLQSGERAYIPTKLKQAGQAMGSGADLIGAGIKGLVKVALPPKLEDKVRGAIGKVGEVIGETGIPEKANEIYNSLSEPEQEAVDAAGGMVSLLSEFVGAGVAKQGAKATGQAATQVFSSVQDVATQTAKSLKAVNVRPKLVPKIVRDVWTDASSSLAPREIAARQYTKAFQLAPSDINEIESLLGGNNIAAFAKANDLIKDNTGDTLQSWAQFKKQNYDAVRDTVSLVDDKYRYQDVPELETIVDKLIADVSGGTASEEFASMSNLLKQTAEKFNRGQGELVDIQNVKSTFDDLYSIYKRTSAGGSSLKEGVKYADLDASMQQLRRFIEDRVSEQYPDVNIKEFNNNVRVASSFLNSVTKRAGKIDTQSALGLGDYLTFGIGQQAAPGFGLVSLLGKKIAESGPIRMIMARNLVDADNVKAINLNEFENFLLKELGEAADIKY